MRFKLTQRASRMPSVVKMLLLAAAVFFCFISGADGITAQTTDDHGNDFSNATNLPLGSSIAGRIGPGNDVDFFKLDLSGEPGSTRVWIYTTGSLDTLGGLFNSSGDLITADDDTTVGDRIVDLNFDIPRTLAPGVYYVSVLSADGTTTGGYTLHAKIDDHGGSYSTATLLPLGSSIAGRIDPGNDRDVFKLDLSGESGNTHVSIYTTGSLDTQGWLYDSRDTSSSIASNDDATSDNENFRIVWTLEPEVYYLSVRSFDRRTTGGGDYTLYFQTRMDDHGTSFPTATALTLGSSIAGRINSGDDQDVFRLDLSGTSGTTDVWIYATGELNTRGWLYDSSGDLLVFNNDSYTAGRETSFSLRRNLPRGVYYVSVRSWLTADGDFATGDYTLHAEAVTGPGSATGTATTLSLDSPTPGVIDMASDADYFRLDLAESKNLVVHANNPFFRYDTSGLEIPIELLDVAMLDSQDAEISVNIFSVRDGVSIEDDFGPGAYYIKVTAPYSDTTYPVPYTIHAYQDTDYTKFIADCEAATAALNAPEISDPLYGCQWHLRNQDQGGEDINVEAVWAEGINGEGVNIAVVDDGMYYAHEDLADNVNTTLNHNYDTGVTDSTDIYHRYEHHGTNVAGVIAARDNDIGVRGVAPRATIYGYNYLAGDWDQFEDRYQANAMSRNQVVTAVSNNSWGPLDAPGLGRANQFWELAIDSGIREGYDGKGVFYVFAAGNGGEGHRENPDGTPVGGNISNVRGRGDDSNLDELANYYAVTAVCAVNDGDTRSVYSEKGANLWVCAPSRDYNGHRGIVTTENSDRYKNTFGGTSAAAPTVSGVAALLRQANPGLTWRDLKLILAASARKNDAANPGWAEGARKYGAGSDTDRYHFNHEYGFGVVDAKAAVDLARGWTNVPPMENASAESGAAVEIPPPQADGTPQTVTTTLTLDTDIRFTEFVEINTDFEHTSFRDMDIELVSPSGAVSKLTVPFNTRHYTATYRRADGTTFDGPYFVRLDGEFRFGSARHLGEDPNGVWTLRLTDHFPVLGGTLRSWNIKVYGHARAILEASPATAVPNQAIAVTGQGFTGDGTINAAGDGSEVTLGGDGEALSRSTGGFRNFNNGESVTVDSGGNWSATIIVPITSVTTTAGTHLLEVTDSGNRSGSVDITIPARTLTIEPAEARPGETVTLTGTGFPATNTRAKEQNTPSIQIYYGGDNLVGTAIPDGDGNIMLSFQVPLDAAIPSTNRVEARYMIPGAPSGAAQVKASVNHTVSTPRVGVTASAARSFSPATVAPGGRVTVTITAANYGLAGGVTETLPAGFSYVSSTHASNQVIHPVEGNSQMVRFTLQGETSLTYTVTASSVEGSYTFSGTLRGSDRNDHTVGGASMVTVSSGDPLVAKYDTNKNGTIEKSEVIKAINDYLFGTGDDAPSKADVIRLINLYLFG